VVQVTAAAVREEQHGGGAGRGGEEGAKEGGGEEKKVLWKIQGGIFGDNRDRGGGGGEGAMAGREAGLVHCISHPDFWWIS